MVVEALVTPAFLDVSPEDSGLDAFHFPGISYLLTSLRHLVVLAGLFPGNRLFFGLCTVYYSFMLGASHCDCPPGSVWGHSL